MKKKKYIKAEIIRLSASVEGHILSGSTIEDINVSDAGQDLAATIDFEDNPFTVDSQ